VGPVVYPWKVVAPAVNTMTLTSPLLPLLTSWSVCPCCPLTDLTSATS